MDPVRPWKNRHLLWTSLAFSFVFQICMLTYETRFKEIKRVTWAKLRLELQKSNNAAKLCSSFIRFRCFSSNQLTKNNYSFFLLKEQSWWQGTENCVSRKNFKKSKFFSLIEVYQDQTIIIMVKKWFNLGSQSVIKKRLHFTAFPTIVMVNKWIIGILLVFESFF